MSVLIKGMEPPMSCRQCSLYLQSMDSERNVYENCAVTAKSYNWGLTTRPSDCPLVPIPPHGRLIDADNIGMTNFEIILCQKGNPFKNALEMLLEKIENAPTVIQASGKDTDVPTREEGK